MKIHELKLDIKYFDEVKRGKKNFEIRKNDRDFMVGDILELKAYVGLESAEEEGLDVGYAWTEHLFEEGYDVWENCEEELADTIKVEIVEIMSWDKLSEPKDEKSMFSFEAVNSQIKEVLKDYFKADRLPNGFAILGIEIVK